MTTGRDLLVDFSSRECAIVDMVRQQSAPTRCLGDIYLRSAHAEGSVASRYLEPVHLISDLRESFPHIKNDVLQSACWTNVVKQILQASIGELGIPVETPLRMHAVFPQIWGSREVRGFRKALAAEGIASGRILSETACLVPELTFRLENLCQSDHPDPLKLTVLFCDGGECRWWSFHLFRTCSPMLLRLTDYAPGWCVDYQPPQTPSAHRVVVLGEKARAMQTLAQLNFAGERLVETPSDHARSALLKGALHLLNIINEQQRRPAPELRLEVAPNLGWRFESGKLEIVVTPDMLLDQANFPISPALGLECNAAAPEAGNWPQINFRLEAGWGQSPKSWVPLASVSLSLQSSGDSAQEHFPEHITLCLNMQNSSEGEISLRIKDDMISAPAFFTLASAIA